MSRYSEGTSTPDQHSVPVPLDGRPYPTSRPWIVDCGARRSCHAKACHDLRLEIQDWICASGQPVAVSQNYSAHLFRPFNSKVQSIHARQRVQAHHATLERILGKTSCVLCTRLGMVGLQAKDYPVQVVRPIVSSHLPSCHRKARSVLCDAADREAAIAVASRAILPPRRLMRDLAKPCA